MKRALFTALAVVYACLLGAIGWTAIRTGEPPHRRAVDDHRTLPQPPREVELSTVQAVLSEFRDRAAAEVGALIAANEQAELDAFFASLTPPPPPPVTVTPPAVTGGAVTTAWPSSLYPCGGDLPPCYVKMRESGGDYNAQNPTSSASGAWQFLDSTWNGYGGYARAVYAPPAVQDAKARELWAGGAGCSHWSAC